MTMDENDLEKEVTINKIATFEWKDPMIKLQNDFQTSIFLKKTNKQM